MALLPLQAPGQTTTPLKSVKQREEPRQNIAERQSLDARRRRATSPSKISAASAKQIAVPMFSLSGSRDSIPPLRRNSPAGKPLHLRATKSPGAPNRKKPGEKQSDTNKYFFFQLFSSSYGF